MNSLEMIADSAVTFAELYIVAMTNNNDVNKRDFIRGSLSIVASRV